MFADVADVFRHALVIPSNEIVVIFRYNEGFSFVKPKLNFYRWAAFAKHGINLAEQGGLNLAERYSCLGRALSAPLWLLAPLCDGCHSALFGLWGFTLLQSPCRALVIKDKALLFQCG